MTVKSRALVALLGLVVVFSGCYTPPHTGKGKIYSVSLRPGLKPVGLFVAPNEEYFVVQTAAPSHVSIAYSPEFEQLKLSYLAYQDMAFGKSAKEAAALAPLKAMILDMPALTEAEAIELPKVFNSERINRIPGRESWVITSSDRERSNVWILGGNPARFVKSGRTALPRDLRGRAVDDKTKLLLLTDNANRLEFFDLSEMKSLGVTTLDCREVSRSMVARDGKAWVGTRSGTIVPVDIEKRAGGKPFRMGTGPGEVYLDLSADGGYLGVAVQDLSGGKPPYPTYIKVFLLDGATQIELASTFFEHKSLLKDVVVLKSTETVVVASTSHLLKWHWGEQPEKSGQK
jgi:hypothetical protein